jgi:hypothetical protein
MERVAGRTASTLIGNRPTSGDGHVSLKMQPTQSTLGTSVGRNFRCAGLKDGYHAKQSGRIRMQRANPAVSESRHRDGQGAQMSPQRANQGQTEWVQRRSWLTGRRWAEELVTRAQEQGLFADRSRRCEEAAY